MTNNLKAIIFRTVSITISMLFFGFWIETGSFDAILATVSIVSLFVFFIDFISCVATYDGPYLNTSMGLITWELFGANDKTINLKKK